MRNLRPQLLLLSIYEVGDFKTSDNVQLRYHVRGAGPPLLACQGGPANISDTLADALAT